MLDAADACYFAQSPLAILKLTLLECHVTGSANDSHQSHKTYTWSVLYYRHAVCQAHVIIKSMTQSAALIQRQQKSTSMHLPFNTIKVRLFREL